MSKSAEKEKPGKKKAATTLKVKKTLIKNGRIITASEDYTADILIEGETVSLIGKNIDVKADKTIDASGLLVLPGGIDPHVHLSMPFMGTYSSDDYSTGTLAALYGGTTSVIDFILQKQGDTLHNALAEWKGRSDGNAYGDYSFHMAVTDFNEKTKKEIKDIVDFGITSFKVFMAYKGALMVDDRQLLGLMEEVKKQGGLVNVHATNGDLIDFLVQKFRSEGKRAPIYHYLSQPEISEAEASARFTDLAHFTGCPAYIVHLTNEGSLNAVRNATYRKQNIFVETCIQYLLLDASLYEKDFEGAKWVMSPPLREKKDQEHLWSGINQGLIQVVATDHCPFMWKQKLLGKDDFAKIPNGYPAVENRFELLFSEGVNKGRITLNKFVELVATNAAKIFGMFPKKGTIGIGSDADIVLFDPNKKHTLGVKKHHMNVDYSGYEGWEVTGKVKTVLLRGEIAIEDGKALVPKGYGQFIPRKKVAGKI